MSKGSSDTKKTPDFSAFMVRKFDLIFLYLDTGQYAKGLSALRNLIVFLDAPIKAKLKDTVTDPISMIFMDTAKLGGMSRGMRLRTQSQTVNELAGAVLLPYLDLVMDEIHQAGYFGWEKGGSWTVLTKTKSGETDRPGIPAQAKQGVL